MTTFEGICIGDELLEGRVRDANAAAFGEFLTLRGQSLSRVTFVRDDVDAITSALDRAESDVVLVSGGLGPTTDDRTREAAAAFADCELVEHAPSVQYLTARFAERGYDFTPNNRRQALLPATADCLPTSVGTAPGFMLRRGARRYYFFPGVPREVLWFLGEYVTALCPEGTDRERVILIFHGLGESALETEIAGAVADAESNGVLVGYRADYPVIELKLAGPRGAVAETRVRVLERIGSHLVAEDDESAPARLGRFLVERAETVTTAESCTAGGIAALLTDVGGSSAWFGRGYVTYANEAKVQELGVLETTLSAHGAVSAQTVCQMASGARRRAGADYALAVSGIAGPGGGTAEKPVGTVHFGLACADGTYHKHVVYRSGDRGRVRAGTAYTAVAMLQQLLERGPGALGRAYDDDDVWAASGISMEVR